jgi:hypothetical protein
MACALCLLREDTIKLEGLGLRSDAIILIGFHRGRALGVREGRDEDDKLCDACETTLDGVATALDGLVRNHGPS